ncbi:hypothetical protein N0V93_008755 [Gnomoniopsis smithogilvyi]|uniref:3'-5' exonuclease domain-containing protein n=1 Tax=Gnomoniopsis smithogilvyi TaxID=1191159 RepID=A0A9W8YMA0_9PEZI|nr:hypothetical protein N0V93_008755 [Gnomoniopsis smithogilvyi]
MMAGTPILVDSVQGVTSLLVELHSIPSSPSLAIAPSIYCDLEGVNLGRQGSLSILTLYVPQVQKVYLVDVFTLKQAAFSTECDGRSLKTILEDNSVGKAFFDIRNDSDALYSHFGLSVAGIHDLQLMELATRPWPASNRYISGLSRCIERDLAAVSTLKVDWLRIKQAGEQLWSPEKGGRYEVFNERPLRPEIIKYCAQDVTLLPQLWELYKKRLGDASSVWRARIHRETEERIKLSQSTNYNGKGKHMAVAPASFQ